MVESLVNDLTKIATFYLYQLLFNNVMYNGHTCENSLAKTNKTKGQRLQKK